MDTDGRNTARCGHKEVLANIYLHPLDRLMEEAGLCMVRYADDFVILCRSQAEAQKALCMVQKWVTVNDLTLLIKPIRVIAWKSDKVSSFSDIALKTVGAW